MSDLINQPRNGALGAISDLLKWARDKSNTYVLDKRIPAVGGMGPGDFLLGKMPEEVNDWSYGNWPMQIPEMSRIPQVKTGRKQQLADTVLSADIVGALGLAGAKMGGKGIDALARTTMEAPMKTSRRNFLAGAGALTATAAAGGLPLLAKTAMKDAATELAPIAKAATTPANTAETLSRLAAVKQQMDNIIMRQPSWNGQIYRGDPGYDEVLENVAKAVDSSGLDPLTAFNWSGNYGSKPISELNMSNDEIIELMRMESAYIPALGPEHKAKWEKMVDLYDYDGNELIKRVYPNVTDDMLQEIEKAFAGFKF